MSVKVKFGSKDIPFVYKGDKLVYPNPIKDGLLLWYDFKGIRNTDTNKEVAKDLSGNGNDGTLTNFNFTEGSGYKDNALVFDGVDDSLAIPELVLDETAMSVVHDGKVYSYEDDKVLTVGEDGEIIGSGKNIIAGSNFQDGVRNWSTIYGTQKVEEGIYKKTFTTSVGAARLEKNFYGLEKGVYTLALKSKFPTEVYLSGFMNATLLSDTRLQPSTSEFKLDLIVFEVEETGLNTTIRLYVREQGFNKTYEIDWYSLVKGETLLERYTPSPEDYTKPTLTPTSLADLQLYNKTLSKDELLHNAKSKGLKQLKPGIVVQDGLVLHYDFSHESNTSEYKGKAFDYSGNGNHGELQNFNFTEESGYVEDGLKFDGVDDKIITNYESSYSEYTVSISHSNLGSDIGSHHLFYKDNLNNRRSWSIRKEVSSYRLLVWESSATGYRNIVLPISSEKLNVITLVHSFEFIDVYINGERKTRVNSIGQGGTINNQKAEITGNYPVCSAKIYNRTLTPEEVAHNYAIEKEKFNIVEGEM